MDHLHFASLMASLKEVPDPRRRRGQRYFWWFLLAIICSGLMSGQYSGRAIAQWAQLHAIQITAYLQIEMCRMPSESTVRRALHKVDVGVLERQIAAFNQEMDRNTSPEGKGDGQSFRGVAVDGKRVRGASTHGANVHLVSCVRHRSGATLGQVKVDDKTNEITAVPELLAQQELADTVVTLDALSTQRNVAQQIRDQHGHYLMVVKRNQPTLYEDIDTLFSTPSALGKHDRYATTSKGHGRLERHTLTSSSELGTYLDWPGVQQVLQRRRQCWHISKGSYTDETTYGLTSLAAQQTSARQLETFWREHWTIENRSHYVRDETLKEDRCQMRVGNAPQALASLKNGLLTLIRSHGWRNIADAIRFYGASVQETLHFLGIRRL